jgi:hypothetical protein
MDGLPWGFVNFLGCFFGGLIRPLLQVRNPRLRLQWPAGSRPNWGGPPRLTEPKPRVLRAFRAVRAPDGGEILAPIKLLE